MPRPVILPIYQLLACLSCRYLEHDILRVSSGLNAAYRHGSKEHQKGSIKTDQN